MSTNNSMVTGGGLYLTSDQIAHSTTNVGVWGTAYYTGSQYGRRSVGVSSAPAGISMPAGGITVSSLWSRQPASSVSPAQLSSAENVSSGASPVVLSSAPQRTAVWREETYTGSIVAAHREVMAGVAAQSATVETVETAAQSARKRPDRPTDPAIGEALPIGDMVVPMLVCAAVYACSKFLCLLRGKKSK